MHDIKQNPALANAAINNPVEFSRIFNANEARRAEAEEKQRTQMVCHNALIFCLNHL